MYTEVRPSCVQARYRYPKTYGSKKFVNQLSRVFFGSGRITPLLIFWALSISVGSVAQPSPINTSKFIHGTVVTTQGQPVPDATVELRDLRGVQLGKSSTSAVGGFVINVDAAAGEYVLLTAKELQARTDRISFIQMNLKVRIELPIAALATPKPSYYIISARTLAVPSKARTHLQAAHKEFRKMNLQAAAKEIDRALQLAPLCTQAFSMRAFIKLAARDEDGAIEDAKRAVSMDPYDAESHVALSMAYNDLKEFQKAKTEAWQALSMRPDSWQAQLEMAKSLYGQGDFILALREVDQVKENFPDVHLVRANVLMRLGREQEAADDFDFFLSQAAADSRAEKIKQIVRAVRQNAINKPVP